MSSSVAAQAKSHTKDILDRFDKAIFEAESSSPRPSPSSGAGGGGLLSPPLAQPPAGNGALSTAKLLSLFDDAIESSSQSLGIDVPAHGKLDPLSRPLSNNGADMEVSLDTYLSRQKTHTKPAERSVEQLIGGQREGTGRTSPAGQPRSLADPHPSPIKSVLGGSLVDRPTSPAAALSTAALEASVIPIAGMTGQSSGGFKRMEGAIPSEPDSTLSTGAAPQLQPLAPLLLRGNSTKSLATDAGETSSGGTAVSPQASHLGYNPSVASSMVANLPLEETRSAASLRFSNQDASSSSLIDNAPAEVVSRASEAETRSVAPSMTMARVSGGIMEDDANNEEVSVARSARPRLGSISSGAVTIKELKPAATFVTLLKGRSSLGTVVTMVSGSWTFLSALVEGIQASVEREMACGRDHFGELDDACFSATTKDRFDGRSGEAYKFKDYAPTVFRKLRHMFGVDDKSYLHSICQDGVSEISTADTGSKSGQKFLISSDGRYFMKTTTRAEARFFIKNLKKYYEHMKSNENSLLCRFFGVHRVKPGKMHLLVLGNVFDTDRVVHQRFDLKGSRVGRQASEEERMRPTMILKDIDFDEMRGASMPIRIGDARKRVLVAQIDNDTKFLAEMGCMDYSMLVGVHKRSQLSVARNPTAGSIESPWARQDAPASLGTRGHSPSRSSPHGVVALMRRRDLLKTGSLVTVSREKSHTSMFQEHDGGWSSSATNHRGETVTGNEIYFMGIIDFLQYYNMKKRGETVIKALKYKFEEISAVPPKMYAARFAKYVTSIME